MFRFQSHRTQELLPLTTTLNWTRKIQLLASSSASPHSTRSGLTVYADSTYVYSYGPPALTGFWHNYYALLCAIFASMGGLSFGFDQGVAMPGVALNPLQIPKSYSLDYQHPRDG
jgi:hypothetical protein